MQSAKVKKKNLVEIYAIILKIFQYFLSIEIKVKYMEKIPGWVERLLMPKLNEITGEIKAIHTRIDGVEKEVTSLRSEMMTKFEAADAKVESLRKETKGAIESLEKVTISRFEAVDSRFDSLEARLPVMEKLAEFEARLAEIERKVAV